MVKCYINAVYSWLEHWYGILINYVLLVITMMHLQVHHIGKAKIIHMQINWHGIIQLWYLDIPYLYSKVQSHLALFVNFCEQNPVKHAQEFLVREKNWCSTDLSWSHKFAALTNRKLLGLTLTSTLLTMDLFCSRNFANVTAPLEYRRIYDHIAWCCLFFRVEGGDDVVAVRRA